MTEIKIRVKHRDTEIVISIPVEQIKSIYGDGELANFIDLRLKSIVEQIKKLEETP